MLERMVTIQGRVGSQSIIAQRTKNVQLCFKAMLGVAFSY
jgi:hypothetical protein